MRIAQAKTYLHQYPDKRADHGFLVSPSGVALFCDYLE